MKIETINIEREGNVLRLLTDERVYVVKQSWHSVDKLEMCQIKKCSIEEITNSDNLVIRFSN